MGRKPYRKLSHKRFRAMRGPGSLGGVHCARQFVCPGCGVPVRAGAEGAHAACLERPGRREVADAE